MIKEEIAKINKLLVKKYGLPVQKNPNPDPVDILIVRYSSCALMSTRICLKTSNTKKVHSCFWIT